MFFHLSLFNQISMLMRSLAKLFFQQVFAGWDDAVTPCRTRGINVTPASAVGDIRDLSVTDNGVWINGVSNRTSRRCAFRGSPHPSLPDFCEGNNLLMMIMMLTVRLSIRRFSYRLQEFGVHCCSLYCVHFGAIFVPILPSQTKFTHSIFLSSVEIGGLKMHWVLTSRQFSDIATE